MKPYRLPLLIKLCVWLLAPLWSMWHAGTVYAQHPARQRDKHRRDG